MALKRDHLACLAELTLSNLKVTDDDEGVTRAGRRSDIDQLKRYLGDRGHLSPFAWFKGSTSYCYVDGFESPLNVYLGTPEQQSVWGDLMTRETVAALLESVIEADCDRTSDTALELNQKLLLSRARNKLLRLLGRTKHTEAALEFFDGADALQDVALFKKDDRCYVTTREYSIVDRVFLKYTKRADFYHIPPVELRRVTAHQAAVTHVVFDHLRAKGWSVLSGCGGSGKTFVLKQFMETISAAAPRVESRSFAEGSCPKCGGQECPPACGFAADEAATRPLRIACVAPTNRAISVLMSSVDRRHVFLYGTIHSTCLAKEKREVDVLICDEASMLSVEHERLLTNNPSFQHAALLLTGDHMQLPPVGKGNLMVTLMKHGPNAPLTENMRTSCTEVAEEIRRIRDLDIGAIAARVKPLYAPYDYSFAADHDLVICMRNEERINVNRCMISRPENAAKIPADLRSVNEYVLGKNNTPRKFVPFAGMPVRFCSNEHKPQACRGTLGAVVDAKFGKKWTVVVLVGQSRVVLTCTASELPFSLRPAFAITVHDAQGLEAESVGIVLPPSATSPLLSLEMLYTAVSRSKRDFIIYAFAWNGTFREKLSTLSKARVSPLSLLIS